jgi:paraquat-inducible protein B
VSRRANPALIGGFVLGGVLLAIIAVVVFGSGRFFRDTQQFISFFEGSVAGLDVGSSVRFRGIDVGSVEDILVDVPNVERQGGDLRIAVIYALDREKLEARGATVRLDNPFDIDRLLALGIRAELSTESLVTGRKYIAIDLDPANPISLAPMPGVPYPEIPTVGTGLDRIQEELYGIIADLGAVQLGALVNVATETLGDVGRLAASPEVTAALERLPETIDRLNTTVAGLQSLIGRVDSTLTPVTDGILRTTEQTTATMKQLETTLADVGVVLENAGGTFERDSPALVQFERAMAELGGASRALRDLADYLERNPSALLRGRPGGGR